MAKLTAANTYTDSELLALFREALAYASQNKSYSIRGTTYTRQDLPAIRAEISRLERSVNAAAGKLAIAYGRHARRT